MGWASALLAWASGTGALMSLTPGWWTVPVAGLFGAGFIALWIPLTRAALWRVRSTGTSETPGVPVVVVPGAHGSLLGRPDVKDKVLSFLRGETVPSSTGRISYVAIERSAAAWQAPALTLAVNSAWPPSEWGDASFGRQTCDPAAK